MFIFMFLLWSWLVFVYGKVDVWIFLIDKWIVWILFLYVGFCVCLMLEFDNYVYDYCLNGIFFIVMLVLLIFELEEVL